MKISNILVYLCLYKGFQKYQILTAGKPKLVVKIVTDHCQYYHCYVLLHYCFFILLWWYVFVNGGKTLLRHRYFYSLVGVLSISLVYRYFNIRGARWTRWCWTGWFSTDRFIQFWNIEFSRNCRGWFQFGRTTWKLKKSVKTSRCVKVVNQICTYFRFCISKKYTQVFHQFTKIIWHFNQISQPLWHLIFYPRIVEPRIK